MKLTSSYLDTTQNQYKVNLHAHTTNSDGRLSPQEIVDLYAQEGYDSLMISDHDFVTDPASVNARSMTLIPGYEITAFGPHILHVNADEVLPLDADRQFMIDRVNTGEGFAIMNHPNWGENFNHCDQRELAALQGYVGIEIYNGVTDRAEGSAYAADRWDRLLSQGRRIWGFGHDDIHRLQDLKLGWNMVFADDADASNLLNAMRAGNFYVSTGVTIRSIRTDLGKIEIESPDTQAFRVLRDHGMVLATVEGSVLQYELPQVTPLSYLRVECYGAGTRMAWTQPFFVE
ncbi:MAG: CehA/McbA family metallohydrolase [Candidatus Hydrogenedentales bacterium]